MLYEFPDESDKAKVNGITELSGVVIGIVILKLSVLEFSGYVGVLV